MNPILKAIYDKGKKRRRKFKMENTPLPEDVLAEMDVSYEIDETTTLMSDIFYPENKGDKKLPVIVMIHGGGFLMGNRKLNYTFRYIMAENGFLVYSLEHRLLDDLGMDLGDAIDRIGTDDRQVCHTDIAFIDDLGGPAAIEVYGILYIQAFADIRHFG